MRCLTQRGVIALLLALSATADVTFHPPVLIGEEVEYADRGFGIGIAPFATLVLSAQGGHVYQSTDSGSSWSLMPAGTPGIGADLHMATEQPGEWIDYANVTDVSNRESPRTSFTGRGVHAWAVAADGHNATVTTLTRSVVFRGLPTPARCYDTTFGGCPFRLSGGSVVTRPQDGALLYSAIVKFQLAPHDPANKYATSIVAFSSSDGGFTWDYVATIAAADANLDSQEGPNENSMVVLPNGTVLAVMRWDAGDGPLTHPYRNYRTSTSSNGGRTWSTPVPMPAQGCARPKLHLTRGSNGGGVRQSTASFGPLLLTGGRHRNANTTDVTLWVDGSSTGSGPWAEYSLTYWHNRLTPNASWAFTPFVNSTSEPRETTSYTSIIPVERSARSEDVIITYNRRLPGQTTTLGFAMRVTVSW